MKMAQVIVKPSNTIKPTAPQQQGLFTQAGNFLAKNWIILLGLILFAGLVYFAVAYILKRLGTKKESKTEILRKNIIRTARLHARREYVKNYHLPKLIFVSILYMVTILYFTYMLIKGKMAIVDFWVMNVIMFVIALFFYGFLTLLPLFKKRAPIYLNAIDTQPRYIGRYYGDFISADGYHNIIFSRRKKWLIFPDIEIIRVNATGEYEIIEKSKRKTIKKLIKLPKDLVKFYKDRIEIYGYSIDNIGDTPFLAPILKDKHGNILDLRYIDLDRLKNTISISTIKDIAEQFANAVNRIPELNPSIQYVVNTGQENIRKPPVTEEGD